ncbi:hypothetical protein DFQ29_001312 [Apophysomyces sp. BC1021]|nr:hypothetical protein DFQ29_001312 [Apophysomyces sp. BC1021]
MTTDELQCNECGDWFLDRGGLKNHKTALHVNEILVGESKQLVKRTDEGFRCPICEKHFVLTNSYRQHLAREGLSATIPRTIKIGDNSDKQQPAIISEANHDNVENTPTDKASQHIPPVTLELENVLAAPRKRKRFSVSDAILDSCGSLFADDDTKNLKISLSKAGQWKTISYDCGDREFGFMTSQETTAIMLQSNPPVGVWKSPLPDQDVQITPSTLTDADSFIHHMKTSSKAAKQLTRTGHTELTEELCNILNRDWLEYPQLRCCGPQILAGAILVEGTTAIILNTIESYSRDCLTDAHHEQRQLGSPSSFPERRGLYGYLNICLLNTADGQKLVLGTRTCNLLVTSSLRLDKESVNLGPSTTHFAPSEKTRVFVDLESIHSAKSMLPNKRQTSAQDMPLLYQMRQLRSKFHSLSTYTKCRASASIASRLELQPSTIWTLSDNDSPQHIPSQDKVGSILFRTIAVAVNCHGKDAALSRDEVESVRALVKNSAVATILEGITGLFVSNTMPIINNSPLNAKLTDLAAAVSQGNKKENEKKANALKSKFYN